MTTFSDFPENYPTPSLLVDSKIVENNIARMQAYATEHRLRLRPHTKTHKSRWVAKKQVEAGAAGLTVAKGGEAEVMASAQPPSLLIAYPAIGIARLEKVMRVAREHPVTLGIDSSEAVQFIGDAAAQAGVRVGILLDVDVGFQRTGVYGPEEAFRLAQEVARYPNLHIEGLMCFPGHLMPNDSIEVWNDYESKLGEVIEVLTKKGIPTEIISGGSTPSAWQSHRNRWLNEIRPGTYIYNDVNEVRLGVAALEDCAARIVATVVSHSGRDKFVIDAGSKTLSSDRCAPDPEAGFGMVMEYPEAKIVRLSEEHGEVKVFPGQVLPKIGTRVMIIPNHICVCVNLQNQFWLKEGSEWHAMPVDARGLLT